MAFHLTQGTFSFLPDLSDDEIRMQVQYCLDNDWPINIEFTDDPHPRNTYWEMWGLPMFDIKDPAAILYEVNECLPSPLYPRRCLRSQQGTPDARPLVHRQPANERSWL